MTRLSQVANIAAVKMPLPKDDAFEADLAQLRQNTKKTTPQNTQQNTPSSFDIGYSGDWGCAAGLLAGASTWYSVVGGLFPVPAMKLTKAAQQGDTAEAHRIDNYFQPLWALFKEFGSVRVVYAAANILALSDASPHLPILPLNTADQQRVAIAIEALDRLNFA